MADDGARPHLEEKPRRFSGNQIHWCVCCCFSGSQAVVKQLGIARSEVLPQWTMVITPAPECRQNLCQTTLRRVVGQWVVPQRAEPH